MQISLKLHEIWLLSEMFNNILFQLHEPEVIQFEMIVSGFDNDPLVIKNNVFVKWLKNALLFI